MNERRVLADIRDSLQKQMLRSGARLSSLEGVQNPTKTRNNNLEGESYSHPTEGENIMNENTMQSQPNINQPEPVAPAGGKTDAEIASSFLSALRNPGSSVNVNVQKPYTRIALETAIPTGIIVVGVIAVTAARVAISNKWGAGAQLSKLGDMSKALNVPNVPNVG